MQWRATNPGTAAVRAGHVQLLSWMLEHRIPVLPNSTLRAVALCCSLRELHGAAWLLQRHYRDRCGYGTVWDRVAEYAAASRTPDAQAKVAWLLRTSAQRPDTALLVSAAGAGNIALLQWLRSRGSIICERVVLGAALEHADGVETAEWLLTQTTCRLPADRNPHGDEKGVWAYLSRCAAASGSVAKLQWLSAQAGGPLHVAAAVAAAQRGHLEAVQYLHAHGGVELSRKLFALAAGSGDMALVAWLRGQGCPMDGSAYEAVVEQGHVAGLRWGWSGVATVGGSGAGRNTIGAGAAGAAAGGAERGRSSSSRCLEAVRILFSAGCPLGDRACSTRQRRPGT